MRWDGIPNKQWFYFGLTVWMILSLETNNAALCIIQSGKFGQFLLIFNHYALVTKWINKYLLRTLGGRKLSRKWNMAHQKPIPSHCHACCSSTFLIIFSYLQKLLIYIILIKNGTLGVFFFWYCFSLSIKRYSQR